MSMGHPLVGALPATHNMSIGITSNLPLSAALEGRPGHPAEGLAGTLWAPLGVPPA
jgi:hypothetical protein